MEILDPPLKERLWHKMRDDLRRYIPEIVGNKLLMCCACGRFLPQEHFNLEHIVPQQALADDPAEVRSRATVNTRSGNILLCSKPLMIRGATVYKNGCNSWKGKYYDSRLRELLNGKIIDHEHRQLMDQHIIAALCAGYLAMVSEYGYQVALTPSGVLMRHQFFLPVKFHRDMPIRCQKLLIGAAPGYQGEDTLSFWTSPFSFTVMDGVCCMAVKNVGMLVPISRDPRMPIAQHVLFKPTKYALRPDFRTVFG
jgi:hypothetical protein